MVEEPLKTCPQCKGKVQRIISGGSGFIFKGSGFYITDYRKKEYKDAAAQDSSSLANKEKKDKSKSDSKAASAGSTSTASTSSDKT